MSVKEVAAGEAENEGLFVAPLVKGPKKGPLCCRNRLKTTGVLRKSIRTSSRKGLDSTVSPVLPGSSTSTGKTRSLDQARPFENGAPGKTSRGMTEKISWSRHKSMVIREPLASKAREESARGGGFGFYGLVDGLFWSLIGPFLCFKRLSFSCPKMPFQSLYLSENSFEI